MIDRNHPAMEALAREVLDAVKVMDATPGTLYLDGPTHEHEEAAGAILDAAPALARAVLELTAELARLVDTPEPLPCGCENPFNAIHLLDH